MTEHTCCPMCGAASADQIVPPRPSASEAWPTRQQICDAVQRCVDEAVETAQDGDPEGSVVNVEAAEAFAKMLDALYASPTPLAVDKEKEFNKWYDATYTGAIGTLEYSWIKEAFFAGSNMRGTYTIAAASPAPGASERVSAECVWMHNEYECEGAYETTCGHSVQFDADCESLSVYGIAYCNYCGKSVREVIEKMDDGDDEEMDDTDDEEGDAALSSQREDGR